MVKKVELRGRRKKDKTDAEKSMEQQFLNEYTSMPSHKRNAKDAAMKVRPDMAPSSAMRWGYRVLSDPETRKKMHMIEQGGLMKIHDLLDAALDVIANFLKDDGVSEKIRLDAAKTILSRVYGSIPDSVTMVKFSIFDGEDKRANLREQIRKKLDEDIIDVG
ncbi:MAG: hypothetical protein GTN80_08185 [Nitrososphaeria archaeon]|nr:hypothetical protein [Nitrososphaeria archaeon]NIQ33601.1 hypothetical protein [Nitrososphaeria archaeon]